MIVNGEKFACETCIRGHRATRCQHTDRPLRQVGVKGRPVSQCNHCRSLRESRSVHTMCKCGIISRSGKSSDLYGTVQCRCCRGEACICAGASKKEAGDSVTPEAASSIGTPASLRLVQPDIKEESLSPGQPAGGACCSGTKSPDDDETSVSQPEKPQSAPSVSTEGDAMFYSPALADNGFGLEGDDFPIMEAFPEVDDSWAFDFTLLDDIQSGSGNFWQIDNDKQQNSDPGGRGT